MKNYSKYVIPSSATIYDALLRLNELSSDIRTLLVLDADGRMIGTVTDGDVRRGLIAGNQLSDSLTAISFDDFFSFNAENYSIQTIKAARAKKLDLVPFLDANGRIVKLFNLKDNHSALPVDAVIMAGGRGIRLAPLTDNVPKPMLPLGNKPIIEHNVDRLLQFGIENICITVRYLGEQIISHFGNGTEKGANISYYEENLPLGTIGSVGQLPEFKNDTVLVMNSDLFTNIDFEEFYLHFVESDSDMAVASIPYNVSVPYAVLEVENEQIVALKEKPTYTYYSNAGVYLMKKSVVDKIPKDQPFDAPDLIELVAKNGGKVTTFPIMGYWIDIGKHEDYAKAKDFIKYLKQ
ncbi:MAG: nucleotidyltransferase family protein [Bacteroidales bacterium]|nr:nucleotidyltransferase family protein [Bacteroidales bacterium]